MKIINARERILKKQYVDIEIDGACYSIYLVNGDVQGIYIVNSDETTEYLGKALSGLTGYTHKGFRKLVNRWLEKEYDDYEFMC